MAQAGVLDSAARGEQLKREGVIIRTWDLMKTYVQHPPRKLQSEGYSGPVTLTDYERYQHVREALKREGINLPLFSGN